MRMKKYKDVNAEKITDIKNFFVPGAKTLVLANGQVANLTQQWIAKFKPQVWGYFIVSNGDAQYKDAASFNAEYGE